MEMKNQSMAGNRPEQIQPISEILVKYWNMIWAKKVFVLVTILITSLVWVVVYKKVIEARKTFTTTAIVKFDDPKQSHDYLAVTDFAYENSAGKIAILSTSTFLKTIADSLKLNLSIISPAVSRFEMFHKVGITEDATLGIYVFDERDDSLKVYLTNKDEDIEDLHIASFPFPLEDNLHLQYKGLELILDEKILNTTGYLKLFLNSMRRTIDDMKDKLYVSLDRAGVILNLEYSNRDPELAAVITNTIAGMYIDRLLQMKRYRTTGVLKSLEEQLSAARAELDKSEDSLRDFREAKPYLSLSNASQTMVSSYATDQTSLKEVKSDIEKLKTLLAKRHQGEFNQDALVYLEILSFLEPRIVGGSKVYTQEFQNLMAQRSKMLSENFSPGHPMIKSIEDRINEIKSGIDERAEAFFTELQKTRSSLSYDVSKNQNQIRKLPENELQLAELERDRDVKAKIYSNILVQYNEAKISDAAIVPDAYVIEEAQVPLLDKGLLKKLQYLIVGPILGLMLAIASIVVIDLFDNTVHNSQEVESKMKLPVLASIPVILNKSEIPDIIVRKNELDPKLVTSDYAPQLGGEQFRLVRTKLMLENGNLPNSYIMSSFAPSDGKSLVISNLAIAFAQQKHTTILLDCDLRRGVLHHSFNRQKKPGLADLLISPEPTIQKSVSNVIQETHVPNLFFISSGVQVPNPSELLGSKRMREIYNILWNNFDIILLDTPPIEVIPDALVLNNLVHKILLVVRYGKTNLNKLSNKLKEFNNIHDDFKGIIINASEAVMKTESYSYTYYQY